MERFRTFSERALLLLSMLLLALLFYNIHWKMTAQYRTDTGQALLWTGIFAGALLLLQFLLSRVADHEKWEPALLVAFLVLAFALRLIWILKVPTEQVSDFGRTWRVAGEIASGNFQAFAKDQYLYVNPHWSFTALAYALIHKISGGSLLVMKLVNAALGTWSCYLAYAIASEICGKKRLLAALLLAVNLAGIAFASVLDPQNLAIPFFYGAVLLYLKVFDNVLSPFHLATVGALLGFGNLFRPVGVIFVVAIFMHALIFTTLSKKIPKRRRTSGRLWQEDYKGALVRKQLGLLLMTALMLMVPFFMNKAFQAAGIFQKASTDGSTWLLYINAGMNHESNGMWNQEDYNILREANFDLDKANAVAKEKLAQRLEDKGKVASLMYRKYKIQWSDASFGGFYWAAGKLENPRPDQKNFVQTIDDHIHLPQALHGAVVLLIFLNLGFSFSRPNRQMLFLLILWVGFVCLYQLIEMQPRYGYIAMPTLMILGGGGAARKEGVHS